MKKLGVLLLSFSLLIGLFPQLTLAAPNTKFEQELTQYLKEISKVRGFEVKKQDIEASLAAYDETIENFTSVKEIRNFLDEVIKSDLSNLDYIYEEYELNKESLDQLLEEHGESINDYIFLDDLDSAVSFYIEDKPFERDPNFDQNFVDYLAEVSKIRGFEVKKEDIEAILAIYETNTEEFETVEDLKDFLGEVIKADLSNLDYFKESYGMDQSAVFQLLKENGKDINDYVYMDELEEMIWSSGVFPGLDEEMADELLAIFQQEIDLTDEELERLMEHFMSLEEELSNPATIERLETLGNRMMAFEDFDMAAELTAEQIGELASIYEELLSIFKLKASYSLVKEGSETPISLMDLMNLTELKGANLKVKLYNTDGEFLADFIITGEMVDSETVVDTGKQIKDSTDNITKTIERPSKAKSEKQRNLIQKKSEHKTVKGAKLPKTASDYIPNALLGLFILFAGIFMYRKVRNA
ncbi:processed acidic surface protein [Metabacillus fastidiosus]|uniref:processed acidic surface protein n=1 Tax=Metabacillus fastidiosus TaxID=1458 RepID=UPI002E1F7131|nr:processed acidic surface protein [Metabacillus fastidiosus]